MGEGKPLPANWKFPPLFSCHLGFIIITTAYLLIRRIFNERIALLSLFFISILPGHIYQTLLGRADHYGADPFPFIHVLFSINRNFDQSSK